MESTMEIISSRDAFAMQKLFLILEGGDAAVLAFAREDRIFATWLAVTEVTKQMESEGWGTCPNIRKAWYTTYRKVREVFGFRDALRQVAESLGVDPKQLNIL